PVADAGGGTRTDESPDDPAPPRCRRRRAHGAVCRGGRFRRHHRPEFRGRRGLRMTALAQRWGYATMPGFDGWEPAKVADALAGLGYRYIEWTPDFCGGENASAATVATLAQASEQAGLRI